jgi:hypothetical protein
MAEIEADYSKGKMSVSTKHNGFSLIELIVFVIVLALAFSIVLAFNVVLNYTSVVDKGTSGLDLAQQRMELIVNNPRVWAYNPSNLNNLVDVCSVSSPPPACNTTLVPGYTVSSTITPGCSGETSFTTFNGTAVFSTSTSATQCSEVKIVVTNTADHTIAAILNQGVLSIGY